MSHNIFFIIRKFALNLGYIFTRPFDKKFVSVLCFHSISQMSDRYSITPKAFQKLVKKISEHSDFIDIEEATSKHAIKRSTVVITFDDGYKDILKLIPTFRKYHIQPLVFVVSDPKNVNRDELANNGELLGWLEINELLKHGVQIGCHTATHPNLASLSNAELNREIINSKKVLENKLGIPINYFAYPKGVYDSRIQKIVKKAGYKAAFSIDPGCLTSSSDRMALPRTIIDKTHSLSELPAVYYPSTFLIRKLTNWLHIWERFLAV